MKQAEDNMTVDLEDIFLWPNGEWCYRYEREQMNHKSDDFEVLYFGTDRYQAFVVLNESK
jgi:hypothetical protein